jgi:CRP-like cAMP-binding protein
MYVIAVGTVQLHKERRVLADVGYGTCVGQAALLRYTQHEGAHIASATAATDCILLQVARSDLTALIHETPRVSRGVLSAVASALRWLYFEVRPSLLTNHWAPYRTKL